MCGFGLDQFNSIQPKFQQRAVDFRQQTAESRQQQQQQQFDRGLRHKTKRKERGKKRQKGACTLACCSAFTNAPAAHQPSFRPFLFFFFSLPSPGVRIRTHPADKEGEHRALHSAHTNRRFSRQNVPLLFVLHCDSRLWFQIEAGPLPEREPNQTNTFSQAEPTNPTSQTETTAGTASTVTPCRSVFATVSRLLPPPLCWCWGPAVNEMHDVCMCV